jgi:uncharacterized membrane protein YraQ (UPF0718 family)/copper chaperone CopZ
VNFVNEYIDELAGLLFDMAPWLMLGFLIAGLLHVFFPEGKVNWLLGKGNTRSVISAALLGVPLPLCSCGVIPAGVSLYKSGASKGSAVSFLISTPQTGVDSIMVTYSMLGMPFALIRPFIALITGIAGGIITNAFNKDKKATVALPLQNGLSRTHTGNPFMRIFKYAFYDFLQDIAKWLVIGLLIAALIAVFVPDDFFVSTIKSELLGMLIILLVSLPMYVCATSSVPIAAVLMMKGLSPGAALVFLMAGPASNAATVAVIGKALGKKTLVLYLATLTTGAILFGMLINYLLPGKWFLNSMPGMHTGHHHELLPYWLHVFSGAALLLMVANVLFRQILHRFKKNYLISQNTFTNAIDMQQIRVQVNGMNCSHCKMNVETQIRKIKGINNVVADFGSGEVDISGDNIDLEKVKTAVEGIGYMYGGII